MGNLISSNTGSYQLACESSPNKQQIDIWLNENKPIKWISEQLKEMDDYISPNSISKYKKYRDEYIQQELMKSPDYQAKVYEVNEQLIESVGKIKKVDMIAELSTIISDSAELLQDAKYNDVKINTVKDLRMVQQTMLEAINIYGDTVLKAQEFAKVEQDPSLLRKNNAVISTDVKSALADILKSAINGEEDGISGYDIIDKLRNGIKPTN